MKYLSLRILLLCILLPPLLYIATIQVLEHQFQTRISQEIESVYVGDTRPLFNGSIELKDAIQRHIEAYLKSSRLVAWGVKVSVLVATGKNEILYPATFGPEINDAVPPDPLKVSAENYRLLNEGLRITVTVVLNHGTPLSLVVLLCYIGLFSAILAFYYRKSVYRFRLDERQRQQELARLSEQEQTYAQGLAHLAQEKRQLSQRIEQIRNDLDMQKVQALRNEDGMIEEIQDLETQLAQNRLQQETREAEIAELKAQLERLEKGQQRETRQKSKLAENTAKRFRTLYKTLAVHPRAIDGYLDLNDELKIKCEEIIHQLDRAPDQVIIKRKVFGKKNRETVLEVLFAYRGRLYFRHTPDSGIEVVAIGTKNSQTRDLEFIDSL
jgi:hypothetical protein